MNKKGRPACEVTYAGPVNSSSDESDIEGSDKEGPLIKIVKIPKTKRLLFRWRWYTLGGTCRKECKKRTELTN